MWYNQWGLEDIQNCDFRNNYVGWVGATNTSCGLLSNINICSTSRYFLYVEDKNIDPWTKTSYYHDIRLVDNKFNSTCGLDRSEHRESTKPYYSQSTSTHMSYFN